MSNNTYNTREEAKTASLGMTYQDNDGCLHYVVYIDYSGDIPHSVETITWIEKANYWRTFSWEAFAEDGNRKDIRLYNSGSGGSTVAPRWADGYTGEYWVADGYKLKGTPKNAIKLELPKEIQGCIEKSTNPFDVGEIVYGYYTCERCGQSMTDYCMEHTFEDDNGDLRYKDNGEIAE